MTSPLVGSARIEISGDLSAFAAESEAKIKAAMAETQATVTEAMAKTGVEGGQAYSRGLTPTVVAGSERAVTEGAAGAGAAANREYSSIGKEAGIRFGESAKETVKGLSGTIFAGVGALGVAELLKGSVEQADQLEGATIKIEGAFGESAKSVEDWAATMADKLGLSKAAAESAAGTFGQMFHAMGLGQPEAASMSEHLSELVQNVARFNNADPTAVQSAFTAAMRGRGKALLQLGINLDSTTIAAEAMRHHLVNMQVDTAKVSVAQDKLNAATATAAKVDKDANSTAAQRKKAADDVAAAETNLKAAMDGKMPTLTQSQKGEAAYYAILDGTKNQEHAVADSSHTLAQQKKILGAEVSNLEAKIGAGLLPILTNLSEYVTRDVLPAIESFGHWVVQNKAWIEPLAAVLAGLAAVFITAKIALAGYNAVVKVGRDLHAAYTSVITASQKVWGWLSGSRDAAAKSEQAMADSTSASAAAVAREGEAAGAAAPEMTALAEATAAAATAQEDLDVAQRAGGGGGVGGGLRGVGKGAGSLESEGKALATVGAEAGAAETALGGVAAEGGVAAAGVGSIGLAALAVPAAIAGIGFAISHLVDGRGKAQMDNLLMAFNESSKDAKQGVDGLSQAILQDNDAFGVASATYVATQLQQQGVADSAKAVGISLGALTAGVSGTDAQFNQLLTTWQASGKLTAGQTIQLGALHKEFEAATSKAKGLTDQANDLNKAVAGFKPGTVTLIDGATFTIHKIKNELEAIDGTTVHVHIAADGTMTAQGGQGGKGVLSGVYADGGQVSDGLFMVGEEGPELGYKSGSHVEIMSNANMMRGMSSASSAPINSGGGGGLSAEDRELLWAIANRPQQLAVDRRVVARAANEGNYRGARL